VTAPVYPYPDTAFPTFSVYAEGRQRNDHPFFEVTNEASYVPTALIYVHHHVSHPLARPVIGEFTTPASLKNREFVGVEQVGVIGTCPGGIKRRVLYHPYLFV
jgi:hypothetical protein